MNKKEIYKRIMKLVSPHIVPLIIAIILSILTVLSSLYMPVLTGRAIDACIDKGTVDFESIRKNLTLFVIMLIVNGLSAFLMSLINNKVTFKIVKKLRNELFDKIHRLPVVYLDSRG
ncbi:MAG: ABC transporter ATP-binding protein, partial [Lachnospiraceae bacterium]|nr:ABC transporter ATP-binding protein [Lachnospiraceae bacterium]